MAETQFVIDHKNLGAHLAEGFKSGNSLIENEQRHPPAVGIPTQRQVSPGTKNYGTLSREDMYGREESVKAAEITAKAGNSAEERSSRRLRNEWGKPRMTRDIELTTLEQVVVRGYVNKVEAETGREIGAMRFGTTKEVAALNLAHGGAYKPSDRQHLRRDPESGQMPTGLTVDLAKPDDGMFRARETVTDENGRPKMDARGGVVERVVERKRDTERGDPPAPQRRPKTLYHINDLRVDSRPGRMWTAQNYDEKGNKLVEQDRNGNERAARTPSGSLIRNEDGTPRRTNHDASGKPIDDRVGAIHRDAKGEIVPVAVERLSDRAPSGHDVAIENTEIAVRGKPAEGRQRARLGINDRLAEQGEPQIEFAVAKRGVTSSSFSVEDGKPTITLPQKFKDKDHELTERARAVAHAEQWANPANPNHDNARKAAAMKPAERAKSPEHAACELTAQHAAMATVTRAGGTYQPQPKAANDKLREHWAKQVSDPAGLDQFGRATDMARRVCDGKQPERNRSRERRSNRASDQIEEHARAQQARGGPQQSRGNELSGLMQSKPVAVRGQGRPTGGAAPAAPSAPAKGQQRA